MDKNVLEIEHLSVSYNRHAVLNDINFSIKEGEIAAIVGPNGSGKTTLIRAILGLVSYRGRVLVNGAPVQSALKRIGYVPQRFTFDRTIPITAVEFLSMTSFEKQEHRKINHVLLEVDMKRHERTLIGDLSGGEFQRILIARALLNDPAILFLDEATSGIDIAGEKSFYEIVSHLNKIHRTTVLLVSHEINMVYRFADQIICLNRDLICFGKPKEAITKEVLEKLYGKDVRFQEHRH
ncbi:MAG TPA: metal ABC transporter ATP-binding protein [Candidatus Omnitrophota bacterium]|nr:metal ABC transporter ATP-binding protein [Candidatus Omnitrophota bacterium]